jgi:hypothetical protein
MLARSRVRPQPVYGFSIGLMSTARPYACCDQFPVPLPHLGSGLGHAVGTGDYATLAWFTASLAIVGGALGAVLESDAAVREAAYASSSDSGEDESFVP